MAGYGAVPADGYWIDAVKEIDAPPLEHVTVMEFEVSV